MSDVSEHGHPSRSEVARGLRDSGQILEAFALPILLLVLAGLGLIGFGAALWTGVWTTVASLGLFALFAARRLPVLTGKRVLLVLVLLALGALVVALKTLRMEAFCGSAVPLPNARIENPHGVALISKREPPHTERGRLHMDDNVVVVAFADQSKAYQALSQLRRAGDEGRVEVRSAVLLERGPDGAVRIPEGDDAGSDMVVAGGGLIGMLVGVLGGPLGVLLGGSTGVLAGDAAALTRSTDQDVALSAISLHIEPGQTALVAEVGEAATEVVDNAMTALGGTVIRRPAAEVYDEIQSAEAAQEAADAEARRVLREQHRAEHKAKWEQFKDKVKATVS